MAIREECACHQNTKVVGIDECIILNVGGTKHKTCQATMKKIPATRLSRLTLSVTNFDPLLNEYFFDRPLVSETEAAAAATLIFLGSSKLSKFIIEIKTWFCDRRICRNTQATLAVLDALDNDLNKHNDPDARRVTFWMKVKRNVWALFDEPYLSQAAKVWLIDFWVKKPLQQFDLWLLFRI
ncbi:unnamed protein product [Brugia pahangi]|uniref:BTB_2 domain-containing protein n=1 Tax=Brugia pahangi TaxID=6280 RepID=A0A0N4SYF2_BRUPA|nr:unnamed protein product [Brugia pahangi]